MKSKDMSVFVWDQAWMIAYASTRVAASDDDDDEDDEEKEEEGKK